MTIVDHQIQSLVNTAQLIDPFDPQKLSNCRYNLRAGKVFLPSTGAEVIVGTGKRTTCGYWTIKPSETLAILTKETIKIPSDMFASYSQLNHLAQKGLMVFNVSIVEPGYNGRLSCFLVNFSREEALLYPDEDIAKICFHQLSGAPSNPKPWAISDSEYTRGLVESARRYPRSFLDIGGLEKRAVKRATKKINRSITFAGVFIGVVVLWSALEPIVSKYVWEKEGVMTTTQRVEIIKLEQELEKLKSDLNKASDELKAEKKVKDLEDKVKGQDEQLLKLQKSTGRP